MKWMFSLLIALVAVVLAGCEREDYSSPVQVVRADFGVFTVGSDGKRAFVPSKTVPLTVGQPFGWVVLLNTKRTKVRWSEQLILPSAPATWGQSSDHYIVSTDRKVATTVREARPDDNGMIYHAWFIAPGDPTGHHTIRLAIEGASPIEFEFNVN